MSIRTLVVEDDLAIFELYQLILQGTEFQLLPPVTAGNEAIEMFGSLNPSPDLVLVDFNLPGKNGLEVASALRSLQPNVALVVCSAHVDAFVRFCRFSHCRCVAKPFNASELVNAMRETLASSLEIRP